MTKQIRYAVKKTSASGQTESQAVFYHTRQSAEETVAFLKAGNDPEWFNPEGADTLTVEQVEI